MDPREYLAGDVSVFRDMDPLARARMRGEAAEARENRQAEVERQARREKVQADLLMMEAAERQQIMARGYTDRELRQFNAENQARTDDRVAELEAELDRLDPARRKAQAQRQQDAQAAVTLMRARQPDQFMLGQVAELERRGQAKGDRKYAQRLDEVARAADAGYISR